MIAKTPPEGKAEKLGQLPIARIRLNEDSYWLSPQKSAGLEQRLDITIDVL
jgi:hypothetical protein